MTDPYVLEFLKRREFRQTDFFETGEGACRLVPPISSEPAESSPSFAKAIGSVAGDVAQKIFRSAKLLKSQPQEP